MNTVARRIATRIRRKGPIPFSVFMEEALYGQNGYYNRQDIPIGPAGDFVTGSSHSPLFARSTAGLLRRLDGVLASGANQEADYLEVGYGKGEHLEALVAALGESERRLMAWDRVGRALPVSVQRLTNLEELAARSVRGLIFSYELFDALPFHRLIQREEGLGELWVELEEAECFAWHVGELSEDSLAALVPVGLEVGQIADVSPDWGSLYARLAGLLDCGLMVTFDYGFERQKLFDPRIRRHGTLACYRRHRVHRDPFVSVGEQDLTAHVDFSALIEAGEGSGLQTLSLGRQAQWLAALGLFDGLGERSPAERVAAMQLLDLEGMGEEIRVLIQARGVDFEEVLPPELQIS